MKKFFAIIVLIGFAFPINAQYDLKDKLKGFVNPEEIVSLSETLSFQQAIEILSKVSEKVSGKKIVSLVPISTPIGVEIDKMAYKKALFIIVQYNNLIVDETPTQLVIKKKDDSKALLNKDIYAAVNEREVKISAVIFEADLSAMQERGINWQLALSQAGISIGTGLVTTQGATSSSTGSTSTTGSSAQVSPEFAIAPKVNFTLGKTVDGTLDGIFRFFETENLGKIITRPTITAINGQPGKTKVGMDFSIKERDFAGNLIDKFYQSGTVIEVTPNIYTEDGIDYIFLSVRIEKSSVDLSATSGSVKKPITEVSTKLLLRNGEETAIGGLLENIETTTRQGIPFLKDLPWWFFGLRYIFGYDKVSSTTQEIVTLLKVELLPTLKERADAQKNEYLKQKVKDDFEQLKDYKDQIRSIELKKEEEK